MQCMQEVIPFAREMLSQGSSRRLVKMYLLGSGLAVCGLVGGLADATSFIFGEKETISMETEKFEKVEVVEKKVVPVKVKTEEQLVPEVTAEEPAEPVNTSVSSDDIFEEEEMFAKAKQNPAITQRRRSRSFAS